MKMESHKFKNRNGLNLRYLTWGQPSQPALILLHGLRSYALTWQTLAAVLAEKFYVIALDQRGRGESDWASDFSTYQTCYYVQDIEDLVEALKIEQFMLLGHSLGGSNALEYNRIHPHRVRALIIEDIGPGSSIQGAGAERIRHEMQHTPLSFNSWDEATIFWKTLRPLIDKQGIQSRLNNTLVEKNGQIIWRHDQYGISQARLTIPSTDLWPAIQQINCPALFIKGELSDFLTHKTIAAMRNLKPEIQYIEVKNASHYVHDDQVEIFNDIVHTFLNQVI